MHRHLEGRADVVPSEMRWSRKHESVTLDLLRDTASLPPSLGRRVAPPFL